MRQVQTQYPAPFQHQRPVALAGLFSWLRKTVNKVVNILEPILPNKIYTALNDFTDGNGYFFSYYIGNFFDETNPIQRSLGSAIDLPLTIQEELILDHWVDNSFIPALKVLQQQLHLHDTTAQTLTSSINLYNRIQEFIAVLNYYQEYLYLIDEPGLSDNAKTAKNQFITLQIAVLSEQINDHISSLGVEFTPKPIAKIIYSSDYSYLKLPFPEEFKIKYGILVSISDDTILTDTENEINTTTENNIIPVTTPIQSNSKQTKWMLWLLAGAVAYRIIKK